PQFDRQVVEILASGNLSGLLAFDDDFLEQAAECGLRSFIMMAGALDASTVKPDLLSYEGPFGVGYAVATFLVENDGITAAPPFPVALARATLEAYFATGRRPHSGTSGIVETIMQAQGSSSDSECVRDLAGRKAGAFVSLHKEGELRGCIGTISATTGNVIDEIIQNAVSAAVEDPRFPPLSEPELSGLEIKVDVLNEPETVDSASRLDAKRFGVIVSKGFRRGLLLPDLEGVDTPELQLAIALRKAGILPDEDYQIERFEVIRYQ
ncbi:MAG: AmmeMemoRadiSam system protein A, partial [Coriobacteriaceae bacterium]|nr:AmmeMemoRadiSam system protein A [Coriobacteriaceae bacterium]